MAAILRPLIEQWDKQGKGFKIPPQHGTAEGPCPANTSKQAAQEVRGRKWHQEGLERVEDTTGEAGETPAGREAGERFQKDPTLLQLLIWADNIFLFAKTW